MALEPTFDIWHVGFPVSNLTVSVQFYCNQLGFKLVGQVWKKKL
jgi:catechol 2,3-dioxygenase-like lactoylglutathione lyase family enzyme